MSRARAATVVTSLLPNWVLNPRLAHIYFFKSTPNFPRRYSPQNDSNILPAEPMDALILGMLNPDPYARLTLDQVLARPLSTNSPVAEPQVAFSFSFERVSNPQVASVFSFFEMFFVLFLKPSNRRAVFPRGSFFFPWPSGPFFFRTRSPRRRFAAFLSWHFKMQGLPHASASFPFGPKAKVKGGGVEASLRGALGWEENPRLEEYIMSQDPSREVLLVNLGRRIFVGLPGASERTHWRGESEKTLHGRGEGERYFHWKVFGRRSSKFRTF